MSSRSGPVALATTTSVSPSLSMSPNAAPRPTSDSLNTAAGAVGHVLEPPVAEVAEQLLGLLQRKRILGRACASIVATPPLTVSRSSQPSLSKSNHAVPKPVYARLGRPSPDARLALFEDAGAVVDVERVHLAQPVGDEQILVAVVVEIAGVDAHAGLRPCPRR